ncbi:hypothetical protein DACRYDRAFT_110928 [Dacryopinax primogenitus]|uniref:Peptidase S9 prolyl oligopeptidase catalytic domain-containing protein n=1 Tax=Dacryopinax primogenitus (strain DJM 731) TaxID=1858805 RepID=M5FPE3_DACPD|nr:uncharacterized protein DACRYDRAFT_110928 [Dacryopinax primogenitus]EJT98485.1 hypothetical protein DACRYDRAFT_110928 [Dacryopinax primogenitus]
MTSPQVTLNPSFSALGPFPQHAREQHFLSPAFPFPASRPPLYSEIGRGRWTSALADGGEVGWSSVWLEEGELALSYPQVRWKELRSTAGWAALQHHSLLHTTLSLPALSSSYTLELRVTQASFFCLLPRERNHTDTDSVEWHHANIYALAHYPPSPFPLLPSPAREYDLYISADYEIRLFGDPHASTAGDVPVTRIGVSAVLKELTQGPQAWGEEDVVPDVVGGWALGHAFGLGLRGGAERVRLLRVSLTDCPGLQLQLSPKEERWTLSPLQVRVLPVPFLQISSLPPSVHELEFDLHFSSSGEGEGGEYTYTIRRSLPLRHRRAWWEHTSHEPLLATYFLSGHPQAFLALPPLHPHPHPQPHPQPPLLLALHGAGVSLSSPFWPAALDRQAHSWALFPSGGTEWGLDWHGPSAQDVWGCAGSFRSLLSPSTSTSTSAPRQWATYAPGEKTVLIGHSNGGQGVWYLSSRYPDLVRSSLPASAWLTPAHYVPLTFSRSAHFLDPFLRGILDSALMGEGNDLFLSNLLGSNVLALHGGGDENVPVWMTRKAVGLAKSWGAKRVEYDEIERKGHWWDEVFRSPRARAFLDQALNPHREAREVPEKWTLTVQDPFEAGGMFNWSIDELLLPGRLGRLSVHRAQGEGEVQVRTTNVHAFSVGELGGPPGKKLQVRVDGQLLPSSQGKWVLTSSGWAAAASAVNAVNPLPLPPVPAGPISSILTSQGPITLVLPRSPSRSRSGHASVAARLARAVFLYLRIDVQIVFDDEVLGLAGDEGRTDGERGEVQGLEKLGKGNLILLGGWENLLTRRLLQANKSFTFEGGHLHLSGHTFSSPGLGVLFLLPHPRPHPTSSSLALVLTGTDPSGLERALRAFPLRTGVPVTQWMVLGDEGDWQGLGGVRAAGWWDRSWGVGGGWFA